MERRRGIRRLPETAGLKIGGGRSPGALGLEEMGTLGGAGGSAVIRLLPAPAGARGTGTIALQPGELIQLAVECTIWILRLIGTNHLKNKREGIGNSRGIQREGLTFAWRGNPNIGSSSTPSKATCPNCLFPLDFFQGNWSNPKRGTGRKAASVPFNG